jgi:hypothetical protein
MTEQFPHLTNTNYISSPDSDGKTSKNEVFTFRPPTPPKNNSESSLDSLERSNDTNCSNIGNGKFEYISNDNDREMLVNAWQAISQTNLWDFVAQEIESFMWSNDPHIEVISEKMEQLGYHEHSGSSFGITMRNMQYLAQHGENKFKELFYGTDDIEKVSKSGEHAMDHEERSQGLIKRRVEKKKVEDKLLEYMGGY